MIRSVGRELRADEFWLNSRNGLKFLSCEAGPKTKKHFRVGREKVEACGQLPLQVDPGTDSEEDSEGLQ